jgi:hypothetical protein
MTDTDFPFDKLDPGDAEKLLPTWTAKAVEAVQVRDRLRAIIGLNEPHSFTNRGFTVMESVPGDYGGHTVVWESSSAEAPKVWLKVVEPNDLNAWCTGDKSGGTHEATVHLTADSAAALARRIEWLLHNHRMGDAWPEEAVIVADLQAMQGELRVEGDAVPTD